jgi:hypothetical protein
LPIRIQHPRSRAVLRITLATVSLSATAAAQVTLPTPAPLILKNTAPHAGTGPIDVAFVPSVGLLYVVDEFGGVAWKYDVDLVLVGTTPSPAGPNRITGIACNPNIDRLYWLDADASVIHETTLDGQPTGTIQLAIGAADPVGLAWRPVPAGTSFWIGDLAANAYVELAGNGVPTGNSFTDPSYPTGLISGGIAYRGDNDDIESGWYPMPGSPLPPIIVNKSAPLTGALTGTPGDTASLNDTGLTGIDEALSGSDGLPSLYFASSSNVLYETKPVDRAGGEFPRGDANSDGLLDIGDPVQILSVLFGGGTPSDGSIDIADPVSLLSFLFAGGPSPGPPHPYCGYDLTADSLTCASHPCP